MEKTMLKNTINSEVELEYFNEQYYFQRLKDFQIPEIFAEKTQSDLRKFLDLPLPHKKMEEWRRTDISRLPFNDYLPLGYETLIKGDAEDHLSGKIEFDEKNTSLFLSDELAEKGVIFTSIFAAIREHPDLVARYFNSTGVSSDQAKFQFWNSAFFNRGAFLYLPKNLVTEKPFEVHTKGNFGGRAMILRNIFIVSKNAKAMVENHYQESDKEENSLAIVTDEGIAEENSNLEILSLQNVSQKSFFFNNSSAKQGRDSKVDWNSVTVGGKLHKSFIGGELDGPGAETHLNGAYFAGKKQHMDMRTMQIHNSGNSNSNLLFKGAVKDKAHTIYQGMIQVAHGAQIVDAYQTNKNLILNHGARADSIPGLEILADDVKCSHGATVGHINPEEVFYLQSRGITTDEARKIIISGFFEEVISKIHDEKATELVRQLIENKINQ